jgi:hypothetical protein
MHMAEPFFGSGAPIWPQTIPVPAFGFLQTPMLGGDRGRTIGVPTNLLQSETYGFNGGLMPAMPAMSSPVAGTVPVLAGQDITNGIMPAAVLAAVAMRRGQPLGPSNDQEVEDFVYDALDLLPGANEVEVRCEGGRVTLTGTVQQKRVKRDAGEIAWAIPAVNDVQNNVTIAARRRSRAQSRETELAAAGVGGRKQA